VLKPSTPSMCSYADQASATMTSSNGQSEDSTNFEILANMALSSDEFRKSEAQLRRDEVQLRRIVDLIPQAIFVIEPDGTPLYANRAAADYMEVGGPDEIPSAVLHPEDIEKYRTIRQESLARGIPFQLEFRIPDKKGAYRWFLFLYNPLRDEHGQILRWYATATDIDERKKTEEKIENENLALREEIDFSSMFEEIVGSSEPLRKVLSQVSRVAPTDSTVLVLGETGTGKELVARAIHRRSNRAQRAFVRVNCAAIPPQLIASELFGHEKGAFTGAVQRRLGRFELANGGTIFLDEIGDLPTETQLALLHVLQEREFERVGSSKPLAVDVRVLAATHRDLKAAVAAGTFREDLFYRLNVFPMQIPALRERVDDIPLLVEYLIERYAKKAGKKIRNIEKKTLRLFQAYRWPGNIRELQNVVERAVILSDGGTFSVDETWLTCESPRESHTVTMSASGRLRLDDQHEKEMIEAALAETGGRVSGPSGAASKLGVPRQTLESKINNLGINKHRFKSA
jgi:formate hydrogenlyase transcriptional activator